MATYDLGMPMSKRSKPFAPSFAEAAKTDNNTSQKFDMDALKYGDTQFFLAGLDSQSVAADIMRAAERGDAAMLRHALENPAALPDFANGNGLSPLMVAAARGHDEVVEILSSHPLVNMGRATADGWTALHYAAHFGQAGAVRSLIRHHAPLDAATASGTLPHMIAEGKPVEEAFWQDRKFVVFMKRKAPEHARLAPPVIAEPAAPVTEATEAEPVKAAFLRVLTSLGLQTPQGASAGTRALLDALMGGMKIADFIEAHQKIIETGVEYDWSGVREAALSLGNKAVLSFLDKSLDTSLPLEQMERSAFVLAHERILTSGGKRDWQDIFIKAAAHDNAGVMSFLHGKYFFNQPVLDAALLATVKSDSGRAAHNLMLWGANPEATGYAPELRGKQPLYKAALENGSAKVFEQMVIWRESLGAAPDIAEYRRQARMQRDRHLVSLIRLETQKVPSAEIAAARAHRVPDENLVEVIELWDEKRKLARTGASKLNSVFKMAAEKYDLRTVMAAYSESRVDRLIRGKVRFDPVAGANAIAAAILYGKHEFARKLAEDGYKLNDADDKHLLRALNETSPAGKKLANDLLSFDKEIENIEEIGRRLPPRTPYIPPPLGFGRFGIMG